MIDEREAEPETASASSDARSGSVASVSVERRAGLAERLLFFVSGVLATSFACTAIAVFALRPEAVVVLEFGATGEVEWSARDFLRTWLVGALLGGIPALALLVSTRVRRSVPFVGVGCCALMPLSFVHEPLGPSAVVVGGSSLLLVARAAFALPPPEGFPEPWSDLP